jgi:hypothetical protein
LGGKYKLQKTVGSSTDSVTINFLIAQGELWIKQQSKLTLLDFDNKAALFEDLLSSINQISIAGTELIWGKIFTDICFNAINDELFRKLVLARICYPYSKSKTVDYLQRYENFSTNEDAISSFPHFSKSFQFSVIGN